MIDDLSFLEEGAFSVRDKVVQRIAQDLGRTKTSPWKAVSGYVSSQLTLDAVARSAVYRQRTASEILSQGYVCGCTDTALAFVALSRSLGLPTRFVETFNASWLAFEPSLLNLQNAAAFRGAYADYLKMIDDGIHNRSLSQQKATEQLYETWLRFCDDISVSQENINRLLRADEANLESHVFVDVLLSDGEWHAYEPKLGFLDGNSYYLRRGKYVEIGKGLDFSVIYLKDGDEYRAHPVNLQRLEDAIPFVKKNSDEVEVHLQKRVA